MDRQTFRAVEIRPLLAAEFLQDRPLTEIHDRLLALPKFFELQPALIPASQGEPEEPLEDLFHPFQEGPQGACPSQEDYLSFQETGALGPHRPQEAWQAEEAFLEPELQAAGSVKQEAAGSVKQGV